MAFQRGRTAIAGTAAIAVLAAAASGIPAAQAAQATRAEQAAQATQVAQAARAEQVAQATRAEQAAQAARAEQAALVAQAAHSPRWRIVKDITAPDTELEDIVAISRRSAWAVGEASAHSPVVYRRQHGRWRATTRQGPASSFAESVAATSASNVWVALANEPAVDHYTGHGWTRTSFAAAQQVVVDGVTTTGPRNSWAFTYNSGTKRETAHHFNGKRWRSQALPVAIGGGSYAAAVSSAAPSDIWAWGFDGTTSQYVTLHYNGRSWRTIRLPAHLAPSGTTIVGEQMLAESRTDAWASLYAYKGSAVGPVILLHWNGRHWHKVTGMLPRGTLAGPIAPDGGAGLWLVTRTAAGLSYFTHYRAGRWTRIRVPAAPAGALDVTTLALIPGTRSLWASSVVDLGFGTTKGAAILKYGR